MRISSMQSLRGGFVSGIALSLLAATAIVAGAHTISAQANDDIWTSSTAAPADTTAAVATPAAKPVHTNAYVGLGDSVAAGLGLPTWTTATAQDKLCGRAPGSYVFEVGRQLKRPHAPYACSGAKSSDLFTRQWISNRNPNIQLNQAFAQGVPAVISITVGANDISWGQLLRSCYDSDCGTGGQTAAVNDDLKNLQTNLNTALQQIEDRSDGRPPVVVLTGYYNPVSEQCTSLLPDHITHDEVTWMTGSVNALNQTIKDMAATYGSFARFAPVSFSGHDLCSSDPWIQGANDPAPIHPTAMGQQVIANSVVQVISDQRL